MARLAAAICPPAAKLRLKHGIGRSELAIPSDSVLRSNCTELHRTAPNCTELHRTALSMSQCEGRMFRRVKKVLRPLRPSPMGKLAVRIVALPTEKIVACSTHSSWNSWSKMVWISSWLNVVNPFFAHLGLRKAPAKLGLRQIWCFL